MGGRINANISIILLENLKYYYGSDQACFLSVVGDQVSLFRNRMKQLSQEDCVSFADMVTFLWMR